MPQALPVVRVLARLIALGGIGFIGLFALDVFQPGLPPGEVLLALLIHLLPSLVLLMALVLAWRRPWLGAVLFVLAAIAPFALLSNPVPVNALLGAPFLASGVLFALEAVLGRRS